MASSRCVAGPHPMNVMTGGVVTASVEVWLQLTRGRANANTRDARSQLFARALTFTAMDPLRRTPQKRTLYSRVNVQSVSAVTVLGWTGLVSAPVAEGVPLL